MTRYRRPSERDDMYTRILELVTYQQTHQRTVMDHLAEWAGGVSAGGGGRRSIGGHSDPTGNRAMIGDDTARLARLAVDDHLTHILRLLRDDDHLFRTVMAAVDQEIPKEPEERGLAHCCNVHGCPDDAWADVAGRCPACYKYFRKNGRDRRQSGQPVDAGAERP